MEKEAQGYVLKLTSDSGVTHDYLAFGATTVSGTISTTALTASGSVDAFSLVVGSIIRVSASDHEYTVTAVSGTSITTAETLISNYSGAVLKVDVISSWVGSDGYLNDAVEASGAIKPAFVPAFVNGLDVIEFNPTDKRLTLNNNTLTDNFFEGGATFVGVIGADTAGGNSAGRIISKGDSGGSAAWNLITTTFSGGFYRVSFNIITSGTTGTWRTNNVFAIGDMQIFTFYYNSSTPTVAPVMRVLGLDVALVETSTPTGTPVDESGGVFTIGNIPAGGRGFDGRIAAIYMYKRALLDYEENSMERLLATRFGITLFDKAAKTFLGRSYDISIPSSVAVVPLIICLHGGGGTAANFTAGLQLGAVLGETSVYAFLDGSKNNNGSAQTWNDGGSVSFGKADDVQYVIDLIAHICNEVYPTYTDIDDVYIVGHSNGAMLGYRIICERPTSIQGLFAISSVLTLQNPDVLSFTGRLDHWHGDADINIDLAGGIGSNGTVYPPVEAAAESFINATVDFQILPLAEHALSTHAPILAAPPYSTTYAQLISDFVFDV